MAKKSKKKTVTKKAAKRRQPKKKVIPIPTRYSSVIPGFRVPKSAAAVEFLQKVFGAKVKDRYDGPNGALFHCELQIGNTSLMCGDGQGNDLQTLSASIYVKDCDQVFAKAIACGGTVKEPLTNQFYGDRRGKVVDPCGNEWSIGTHVEDVSKKEMERRMQAMAPPSAPSAAA